jgi:hypothetical protein
VLAAQQHGSQGLLDAQQAWQKQRSELQQQQTNAVLEVRVTVTNGMVCCWLSKFCAFVAKLCFCKTTDLFVQHHVSCHVCSTEAGRAAVSWMSL